MKKLLPSLCVVLIILTPLSLGSQLLLVQGVIIEDVAEPIHTGEITFDHSIFTTEMCLGPDDSVYSLAAFQNTEGISTMRITKWDSTAQVVWDLSWDQTYTVGPSDIVSNENGIYIVGTTSDVDHRNFLVMFNHEGEEQWMRSLSSDIITYIQYMKSASDGSIYLSGFLHQGENQSFIVMKYSSSGILQWLWSHEYPMGHFATIFNVVISYDDSIFAAVQMMGGTNMTKLSSSDGSVLDALFIEDGSQFEIEVTQSGDFVFTNSYRYPFNITWYDHTTGMQTWSHRPDLEFGHLLVFFSLCGAVDAAPDNSVYYLYSFNETNTFTLTKLDETGSMVWNRSLEYSHMIILPETGPGLPVIDTMEVSDDGRIYLISNIVNGTALNIYQIGSFTPYWQDPPPDFFPLILTAGAGSVLGVIVLMVIIRTVIDREVHRHSE